jgi:hypothetical protein
VHGRGGEAGWGLRMVRSMCGRARVGSQIAEEGAETEEVAALVARELERVLHRQSGRSFIRVRGGELGKTGARGRVGDSWGRVLCGLRVGARGACRVGLRITAGGASDVQRCAVRRLPGVWRRSCSISRICPVMLVRSFFRSWAMTAVSSARSMTRSCSATPSSRSGTRDCDGFSSLGTLAGPAGPAGSAFGTWVKLERPGEGASIKSIEASGGRGCASSVSSTARRWSISAGPSPQLA